MPARRSGAIVLALVLAACGGQTASTAAGPSQLMTPSATPSPTPEPGSAFLAAMEKPGAWLRATVTGTQKIETEMSAVTGTYEAVASAFRAAFANEDATTEQRFVSDRSYFRTGEGLWYVDSGDWIDGSLITAITDAGAVTTNADGTATITIKPTSLQVLANGLGLTDETFATVTGTAELTINALGEPDVMSLDLVAEMPIGEQTFSPAWTLSYQFDLSGSAPLIDVPEQAWTWHQKGLDLGYLVSIPDRWTVERDTTDPDAAFEVLINANDAIGVGVSRWVRPTKGLTASEWFTEVVAFFEGPYWFGTNFESNEPLTVSSGSARLLTVHAVLESRQLYMMVAVMFYGDVAYYLIWSSPPGNEATDRELFLQLVGTFQYVPLP
jgi:hypothetical protein